MQYVGANDEEYDATLGQSLTAPEEELPTMTATPMIEVVAPATLSEGYKFDAHIGDKTFQVTVPPGGIEGGQKFMVPMDNTSSESINNFATNCLVPKIAVPVGHWKDGLCDCCSYGPCHNHCLMAFFCPLPAAGQVISRLKLNVWGKPAANNNESAGAFQKLVTLTIAYFSITVLLNLTLAPYDVDPNDGGLPPPPFMFFLQIFRAILHYAYLSVLIIVLWNVRSYVRNKYAIPKDETCQLECEDLLCAVCCSHLSVAQLLRHTTDYETYNATCCTRTGVAAHVPSIV